ncbi:MAG: hypothetical protein DRJ40_06500 [Thermoprotei archaeon]|nr:MAG: hypothetical protein DRJ40_06500 [Thermoprotei archaeon]
MSIAEKLLEELRAREDLRRALAEELLPEIVRNRRLRTIILASISREVATKEDIRELRDYAKRLEEKMVTKEDLEKLRLEVRDLRDYIHTRLESRIDGLEQRVARLEGMMSLFIKLFIAFNVPLLIAVIGILLKMIWT